MSYDEFVNKIKESFQKDYKHSKENTDRYFNTSEAKEILADNYKCLNDKGSTVTIASVTSTLDMLYE